MEKIHKFIECLLPVTSCNIKCSYCYVIQENRRKMEIPKLDYSIDTMIKAMTKERFGGTCYFSICGAGETLIPDYTLDIVYGLLKNGHYVNITTNGTISKRFDEIVSRFPLEYRKRLHIAFSFHYLELKRLQLMERFFENIKKIKSSGCSFTVQLNMCDDYMPYINDIKEKCVHEIGAYPQVAVTRKEESYPKTKISIDTNGTEEEYVKACREFESPLFEYTYKNFMVKRKEFCYAGDWSYVLNLKTGLLKRCYCSCIVQNIFKNIEKPIFSIAVGNCCNAQYCNNSSHFMTLGVIPELKEKTYGELRNRGDWYQAEMKYFLDSKLGDNNQEYSASKKTISKIVGYIDKILYGMYLKYLNFKVKKKDK